MKMSQDITNLCYNLETFKSATQKPKPKEIRYVRNKILWEHLKKRQDDGHCHRCDAVISLEQTFNLSRSRAEIATWRFIKALQSNYKLDWSDGIEDSSFVKEASFIIKRKREGINYLINHTKYLLTLQQFNHITNPRNYVVKCYICNLQGRRTSVVQILGAVAPITYIEALRLYNRKLKALIKKNGNPLNQVI